MLITPEVVAQVEACIPLGPLHNPPNLVGIRIAREVLPGVPNVAVFDTAFHQTMPPRAYTYPVPLEWLEQHEVRRYGFHGTSHRYVAQRAQVMLGLGPDEGALLTAHLGNGCSATAVLNGRSVDTTMGLTPLEGLVMGTRSGSVDPALIGHVARATGQTADQILDTLNKKSGLLGLSGHSNDMRTLEAAAAEGHARAQLAIEVFCYVLAKQLAGPGGRARSPGRPRVHRGHRRELDARPREGRRPARFPGPDARPRGQRPRRARPRGLHHGRRRRPSPQALVVPTNEELMIAMDTAQLVAAP